MYSDLRTLLFYNANYFPPSRCFRNLCIANHYMFNICDLDILFFSIFFFISYFSFSLFLFFSWIPCSIVIYKCTPTLVACPQNKKCVVYNCFHNPFAMPNWYIFSLIKFMRIIYNGFISLFILYKDWVNKHIYVHIYLFIYMLTLWWHLKKRKEKISNGYDKSFECQLRMIK